MIDSVFLTLLLVSNGIWRIHGALEKTPASGLFSDRQPTMGVGWILAGIALIFDSHLLFHARHDWQIVTMLFIGVVALVLMVSSRLLWDQPRQSIEPQTPQKLVVAIFSGKL